ncbi:hypothetical protein [Rossellomorea arthrocnemi]|uniref:hypothetical protein n=1 Tax=Rossellomorea arthrocnemi TaxID=2769542 RepID=UPI0019194AF9|nr:hypothetical protein [Rossellomorea arthrocnemi]
MRFHSNFLADQSFISENGAYISGIFILSAGSHFYQRFFHYYLESAIGKLKLW